MQTNNRNLGRLALLAMLVMLLAAGGLTAVSYYYRQTFDSLAAARAAGWTNFGTAGVGTHNISRDGLFFPVENAPYYLAAGDFNSPGVLTNTAGELYLYGRPNNGNLAYNNIWTGKAVQFFPSRTSLFGGANASASPENPFGFMIVRTHAHIDPNVDIGGQGNSDYHQSAINIWLVQDQTLSGEWDNYANFVYFMEITKRNGTDYPTQLGYFDGYENFPANGIAPDNTVYAGYSGADWRINYDAGDDLARRNEVGYGTPINQNNKPLAIRITHDGTTVRYYLNGDPYGTNAFPATFHSFGESSVSWSNNMKVMVGHETLYFCNESQSAKYTDFVIRTVCTTLNASITPQKVLAGGTQSFRVTVNPTIAANDSGIGEIIIRKPAYITSGWVLTSVVASNAVSGSMTGLTRLTTGLPASSAQFRVMTNQSGDLKVLFRTDTSGSGVIGSATANKQIIVGFQLVMPPTANGSGADFAVFANLEKYDGFTYDIVNLPTTGMKKATPVTTGSLLVQSFYQPAAFASVTTSPSVINEGAIGEVSAAVTYEISTRDVVNRPELSRAMIVVPSGFAISNVQSLLIANDTANIQVTSSNTIILNYSSDAIGRLPSPDGYDRITFTVHGTPNIPDGVTNQLYTFSSKVDSAAFVSGTTWQATSTNTTYPSQKVTVAAADPIVRCHVFPATLGNAIKTNQLTYTVKNQGNAYNNVRLVRILVDTSRITSVSGISSSKGAAFSYTAPYLTLNYSGVGLLASGQSDIITFTAVHNISDINNPASSILFTSESDNDNGKGYVANLPGTQGWTVTFMPPNPQGEAYVTPGEVWTSDVTTPFTVSIYNNGPKGDKVYQALIAIPSIFTNAATATVTSSLIVNPAYIEHVLLGGTNYIWLRYNLAGTNIVSRNEVEGVVPKDTVQITLADNVTLTTNRYTFNVFVDNKTNASFAGGHTVTNKAVAFSTNSLNFSITYPPVIAAYDVQSRFTNTYLAAPEEQFHRIDASTATNMVVVRIQNNGAYGNFIRSAYIYLPSEVSSNIVSGSFSSTILGTAGIGFVPKSGPADAYLHINYSVEGTSILAGQQDEIRFRMIDHVSDNRYAAFTVRAVNDRHNFQLTNIISGAGNSGSLEFFIPPARGAVAVLPRVFYTTMGAEETNTVIITVSNAGGGSNNLTKVNILYPPLYHGKVIAVGSSWLKVTNSSPGATNVTFTYSPVLSPRKTDTIYLRVRTSTTALSRIDWDVRFDNSGTTGNPSLLIAGGSKSQWATQRPWLNVYETASTDHDVLTSNITNTVRVRFVNGTNMACQSNWRYRITVPEPFEMPYVAVDNSRSASTTGITYDGRNVIITYSSPLTAFNFDEVVFTLTDSFEEQETNTVWTAAVDYGDGIWHPVASNGLVGAGWFTNTLSVVLPPATASVYLEPTLLYVDATSQRYTLVVQNTGIPGNHIRMLEVVPPDFITNITAVSNSGSPLSFSFSNKRLYLTYTGDRLLVGNQDVITFTGFDNAETSTGTPVSWSVRVANKADTNHLFGTTIASGKTLSTLVTFPEFRTEFSVTPNTVDTSALSNTYTFYIENKSPQTAMQDSYIQKVRILFPTNQILTNGAVITSSRASLAALSNGFIYLEYATPLAPKSNDMVVLKLRDTVFQGDLDAAWDILVNYNTMGTTFTNANLMAGSTNLLSFRMPDPAATASLAQREVYTTSTNVLLTYVLSNAGTGSNDLTKMWLDLPPALTGSVSLLSNRLGGTLAYAAGRITVSYTNFTAGRTDRIYFTVGHAITAITNYALTSMVSNSTRGAASVSAGLGGILSFVTPPTVRITPEAVYTTISSTNVQLYLYNNGSGSGSVQRVRVTVPDIYTALTALGSSHLGTQALPGGNTVEISYAADPLLQGQDDVLTFGLTDAFTHGYSNVRWTVDVDNGTGYAPAAPESATALSNRFVMPAVQATGVLLTTWINASDTPAHFVTNVIQLAFTNTGTGSNNIYRVKVVLPDLLSTVSGIASSKGGNAFVTNGTNLTVYYTNNLLAPGQSDVISFTLVDNVNNELAFTYNLFADNDDGNGLVKVAEEQFSVFIKEEEPEVYIRGAKAPYIWETVTNNTIYTMDDAGVLALIVKNQSKRFGISQVSMALSNMYTVTAITSQVAGGLPPAQYVRGDNLLTVSYGATNVGVKQSDVLFVYFSYNKTAAATQITATGPLTNILAPQYRYAGTPLFRTAVNLGRDRLILDNATFGRFLGRVLPGSSGATVTLKYDGSQSLATNIDGATFNAPVNTTTGVYVIDKIPVSAGQYSVVVMPPAGELRTNNNVVYSAVDYQAQTVSNQAATANILTTVSNVILKYAKLSSQAIGYQEIYCPEDPLTKLSIPPGTLFEGITVNISLDTMDTLQRADAMTARVNRVPVDASVLRVYNFDLLDAGEQVVKENGFKADVTITLGYDPAAVTAQAWNQADLGIYYWKPTTHKWVYVGGLVDPATGTVTARVNYLHGEYALMAVPDLGSKPIRNVVASPSPFTPGRGAAEYSNLKISFSLDRPYDSYTVKIYNLQGRLIRSFTGSGEYSQGEVFWDGKTKEGFFLSGGVYLYQIHAGSNVFSGSVLLLR